MNVLMILFGHVARARRLWGGAGEKEGGEEISPREKHKNAYCIGHLARAISPGGGRGGIAPRDRHQ